jgi:hypothetical protein
MATFNVCHNSILQNKKQLVLENIGIFCQKLLLFTLHNCWNVAKFPLYIRLCLGGFTPSYILHTRAFGTYLLGGYIYLAENIIRWWYFTCKNHENIICDGILHVNMFHYFKIPYFTCTFFYKNYLKWIYWTLFFIARCF